MLLTLLPLLAAAQAQVSVLVSSFEGVDPSTRQVAAHLPSLIEEDLAGYEEFLVLSLKNAPPVEKYSAVLYMLSCPPGEFAGCTYVVGQRAKVRYAITGRVRPLTEEQRKAQEESAPKKSSEDEDEFEFDSGAGKAAAPANPSAPVVMADVDVSVLDVESSQELLDFVVPYRSDAEATFASGIGFALLGVVQGDVGAIKDIRSEAKTIEPKSSVDREAVIRDLDALNEEMGEVERPEEENQGPRREKRPRYTFDEMVAKEAARRPWDKMGLTPREYVTWWNSGWDIDTWRKLSRGRHGQILVRPVVGLGVGPVHQRYHARYSRQSTNLELLEVYAFQDVSQGFDLSLGLAAGYGITPNLEVEAGLTVENGRYQVDIYQEIYGQEKTPRVDTVDGNTALQGQVGARYVALPTADYRPLVGLGVSVLRGTGVLAHTSVDESFLPTDWPAPILVSGRLLVGAETSFNDKVGAFVQVPVSFVLNSYEPTVQNQKGPYLASKEPPAELGRVGASFQAGIQLRYGGAKAASRTSMNRVQEERDDDEEPEE